MGLVLLGEVDVLAELGGPGFAEKDLEGSLKIGDLLLLEDPLVVGLTEESIGQCDLDGTVRCGQRRRIVEELEPPAPGLGLDVKGITLHDKN